MATAEAGNLVRGTGSVSLPARNIDPELLNFARLVPCNADAINAFTDAFVYMIHGNHSYHIQFCVADVEKARRIHQARMDMQSSPLPNPTAFQMLDGFYRLSIDIDNMPDLAQGWRLGRGNHRVPHRGVELLALRSDAPDALSILHCRFRLHPQTGVLLVKSMTKDKKVSYLFRGQEIELDHGQERPLCQRENPLFIGSSKFSLEYTVPLEEESHGGLRELLQGALEMGGDLRQDPPLAFGFLPGDPSNSLQKNFLLSHNTRACGGFGWIHTAIDTTTGGAAAVKALQLRRDYDREEAVKEVRMWREISAGSVGLLSLTDAWCEHGKTFHDCKKLPERVFFASPLGRFDMYSKSWMTIQWRDQLTLLRQTLEGLAWLHRQGIMHRDVSCKNMLVMSLIPPHAVVHDYGKAIRATHASVHQLGPLAYVAPEVDGRFRYTNLVDAWSWAYSVVVSFGYSRDARTKITTQRLVNIHHDIDDLKARKPYLKDLLDLVQTMLIWDPQYRMSVINALKHPCWKACSDRYKEDAEASDESIKRIKRTDSDSSVSSGRLIAVATPTPDTDVSEVGTIPTQIIT